MVRILLFLLVLAAFAFGFSWIADQPGSVAVVWGGQHYEMDLIVGVAAVLALVLVVMLVWGVVRFIFRIPSLMSLTARMRRRNKGLTALTRGILAAGAGDAKTAARSARDAEKLIGDEPLTLLLSAQAAQLTGDRARAERVFQRMAERPETQALGLRGLHAEARRRGDDVAAHEYARRAHEAAALPWAGQAMLEKHAMGDDWAGALSVVEANLARKTIDRESANRQRAVLKTAIALKLQDRDPTEALALAREAIKLAPTLTPANALAGALLARKGDLRRASKLLEAAWRMGPHPDLARVYVDIRPGDSAADRLARAKTLARLAPDHVESRLAVARAALEARDFQLARQQMAELIAGERRPSARMCLMMADIEETEHGPSGRMREWLARAARAPRDPAWVADGVVSEEWLPASPINGRIDAFRWETPVERLGSAGDTAAPPVFWEPPADVEPEPEDEPAQLAAPVVADAAAAQAMNVEAPPAAEDVAAPEPRVEPTEEGPAEPVEEAEPVTPPTVAPAPAREGPGSVPTGEPSPASPAAEPRSASPSAATAPGAVATRSPLAQRGDDLPPAFVTAPDDPGPEPQTETPPRRGLFG